MEFNNVVKEPPPPFLGGGVPSGHVGLLRTVQSFLIFEYFMSEKSLRHGGELKTIQSLSLERSLNKVNESAKIINIYLRDLFHYSVLLDVFAVYQVLCWGSK